MDKQIKIGNYKVAKEQEADRNIYRVSLVHTNVSKERTVETVNSFTEWSEREATQRYCSLVRYAHNNP